MRYQFKDDDINGNTFITNIAVEVGKTCDDTWVYASDQLGYGLLVYDLKENDSWRFVHGFFHPDPLKGDFNVAGMNFQWEAEGIFGMALSPRDNLDDRVLFFHPLTSFREFAVPTSVLKAKPNDNSYHKFIALNERIGHSTTQTMTDDGIMLFNLVDHNGVGCWNWNDPYDAAHQAIIAKDDIGLVFPSEIRVVDGNVWVLSNRLHVHLNSKLDFNDINFRVYFFSLDEALAGTVCQRKTYNINNPPSPL